MSIQTVNPATGKNIKTYPLMSSSEIEQIISLTHADFLQWSELNYSQRADKIQRVAELLQENKTFYAELMAKEMGKPITAGTAEIEKCALVCNYYVKNSETFLQPQIVHTELNKSYVTYEPCGIIFAIMPWNFPFWQVFRFAIPALMSGNACLLKHAAISTGTGLEIEKLFQYAGLPSNVFRTLIMSTDQTASIIANPQITGVTLTGSPNAGTIVASEAGKNLKKVVLELGGNDAYVILEDADLELAADICVNSRLANSGQVCIAAKRIIALPAIYEDLIMRIQEKMEHYKVGDPLDKKTQMGPLARKDLRATVHHQVQQSIEKGARILLGGKLPESPGFYYPPTLLVDVKPNMPAFDEEIFGPIVAVTRASSEENAIHLANQTEYGLGAAVFTRNLKRGEAIARYKLKAGTCSVNTFVRSDPRLPFGGIKHSGYGRELSDEGLKSFLNIKTILIDR